jgi:superoxide dismutase
MKQACRVTKRTVSAAKDGLLVALAPMSGAGQIMELHHKKHHQAYVTNYNAAIQQYSEVRSMSLYGS